MSTPEHMTRMDVIKIRWVGNEGAESQHTYGELLATEDINWLLAALVAATKRAEDAEGALALDLPRAKASYFAGLLHRIGAIVGCTHLDELEQCILVLIDGARAQQPGKGEADGK